MAVVTPPTPPEAESMPERNGESRPAAARNFVTKLAISLMLGAICVFLLRRGSLSLVPDRESFARVDVLLVAIYFCLQITANLIRAARWQCLLLPLAQLPLWTVIRVALVGYAAQVVLPLRAGEFARPLMIAREGRLTAWAATGTIAAERVVDGVWLSLMLLVSLLASTPLDPLPNHIGALPVSPALVSPAAYAAVLVFVSAFAVMVAFYRWRSVMVRLIDRTLGRVSAKLGKYVSGRLEQLARGLDFLPDTRYSVPFLGLTALYWFLNAATFVLLGAACHLPTMSFAQGVVIMGVLGLGIAIPSAPGQFGAFQLSVYAGLSLYFLPAAVSGPGSSYVFLLYVAQIAVALGSAAVALLLRTPARSADSLIS